MPANTISPEAAALAGIAKLFQNESVADFTITCGRDTYRVHKAIIGLQSEYFSKAVSNGFQESEKARIDLAIDPDDCSCDDPEAVRQMVYYMYHNDYKVEPVSLSKLPIQHFSEKYITISIRGHAERGLNEPAKKKRKRRASSNRDPGGNMLAHARIFAIAVKYGMPALRALAAAKFQTAIDMNGGHDSLSEVIDEVYRSTNDSVRDLRSIVFGFLSLHSSVLDKEDVADAVQNAKDAQLDFGFKKPRDPSNCTRITLRRYGGGGGYRFGRCFNLDDPVSRIYEWHKVMPWNVKAGMPFVLLSKGEDLIDSLNETIAEADLKDGTVQVLYTYTA